MSHQSKRMRCAYCGSLSVRRDADAEWDEGRQEWVLVAVYDQATCEDCGGETSIDEEVLSGT